MERSKETLIAEKKVFDTLKCPCCWGFVGLYFEQCINSHTVCSQCKKHIPNCPICRGQFVGRPVLLAEIIEQLIQIFSGLSSGDRAVDAYLKDLEPTPIKEKANTVSVAPQQVENVTNTSVESPVYNATLASRSFEVFLQQQSLMMRPHSKTHNS